jgi:hypothetical protein
LPTNWRGYEAVRPRRLDDHQRHAVSHCHGAETASMIKQFGYVSRRGEEGPIRYSVVPPRLAASSI